MVLIKIIFFAVILTAILCPEFAETLAKKERRHIKHKKFPQNGKLKAAPTKNNQRNGKMNYYNSHLWPTTTTYYRPATTSSLYLRSPVTSSASTYLPMHWSNAYISPSSPMASSTLRRTDDFSSSSPMSASQPSVLSIPASHNSPKISITNSQIPTVYDLSAFTGNAGMMESPFVSSSQNLWPMSETVIETPKPKLNLFNSFNYNDDSGIFSGFLNQFLK